MYSRGIPEEYIEELSIENSYRRVHEFLSGIGVDSTINSVEFPACLKIKPLTPRERTILSNYLNDYILNSLGATDLVAVCTGTTTIDIIHKNNDKSLVFDRIAAKGKTLYVGDEVDVGNDFEIAKLCTNFVHTSGVAETRLLLQLLCR